MRRVRSLRKAGRALLGRRIPRLGAVVGRERRPSRWLPKLLPQDRNRCDQNGSYLVIEPGHRQVVAVIRKGITRVLNGNRLRREVTYELVPMPEA